KTVLGLQIRPRRGTRPRLCGAIVRGSAGIWQRRALERRPMLRLIQTGRSSASLGSFPRPGAQWLHKADYKLQRIPEGARSDAGANEPRGSPLSPDRREGRAGKRKAWDHTEPRPACLPACLAGRPWETGRGGKRRVISRSFQRGSRKRRSGTERPWRAAQEVFAGGSSVASGKGAPPIGWALLGKEPKG
uniref:Uncharacterized protein n=1 Tax=Laticauda laticaudata TaxID=8630 RepID=A0A8C5S1E0_LATLA